MADLKQTDAVRARCPACRSKSFKMFERLEMAHVFEIKDGRALPMQRDDDMPTRIGFTAHCDACGHDWSPRHTMAIHIMDAEEAARGVPHG